jgi:hypothetical protein
MGTVASFPVSETERYSVTDESHISYRPYVSEPYAVVRELLLTHPPSGVTLWYPVEQIDRYADATQALNMARHLAGDAPPTTAPPDAHHGEGRETIPTDIPKTPHGNDGRS